MRAKILKISFGLVISVTFLVLLFTAVVQSASVQKVLIVKVSEVLSKEFNTTVSITGIKYRFPRTVIIDNAYIADQKNDTLFFVGKTEASVKYFSNEEHKVQLADVSIDHAFVNFRDYAGDTVANYEFFFDYFAPPAIRDPNRVPVIWTITSDHLLLNHTSFSYRIDDDTVTGRRFNESDFRFNEVSSEMEDFSVVDDSLHFEIKDLKLQEKNSFRITEMRGIGTICSKTMELKDMLICTSHSELSDYVKFSYESWRDFSNFEELVTMEGNFNRSRIHFKDIAYFTDELVGWEQEFLVNGQVKGELNSLKGKNVDITSLENTRLKGSFSIKGLPDIESTFMDFKLESATSNSRELAELIRSEDFPKELDNLGDIQFKGAFTGFLYDFVAYGDFRTELGVISSDINMKLNDQEKFSGSLNLVDFDLGTLINQQDIIHNVTIRSKVSGEGFDLKTMNATLESYVDQFGLLNYSYNSIRIDGSLNRQAFEGKLNSKDPNLLFDFDGRVDLGGEEPFYDFVSTIHHADLAKLGFDTKNPTVIKARLDIDFQGAHIDSMSGNMAIGEGQIIRNSRMVDFDSLRLKSYHVGNNRYISLRSDFVDLDLNGRYQLSVLDKTVNNFVASLLPNIVKIERVPLKEQEFDFVVNFKNSREIIELFQENAWIDQGEAKGHFDADAEVLKMNFNANRIHYQEYEFQDVVFNADAGDADEDIRFGLNCSGFYSGDSSILQDIKIDLGLKDRNIDYDIELESRRNRASVELAGTVVTDDTAMVAYFKNSSFTVDSLLWDIHNASSLALVNKKNLLIPTFRISHADQFIEASGYLKGADEDNVRLNFSKFDLGILNPFLFPEGDTKLSGIANGDFDLVSVENNVPLFSSKIAVTDLALNNDTLGNLQLNSKYRPELELININAFLENESYQNIKISGFLKTGKANNGFNLVAKIDSTRTAVAEPFLVDIASDLRGYAKGTIRITGSFKDPEINGEIELIDAGFRVDYLNTNYFFSSKVKVYSDRFDLGSFAIRDERNGTGKVEGFVTHDFFSDFKLNVQLRELKNFLCLNTTVMENEYYYGTAFMTGSAKISGTPDNLIIDIKGRTEKGTEFFVPLENYGSSSEMDFIRFVNLDEEHKNEPYQDLTGIQLNFDLQITPAAEIQLIFDSKLGDIIKAKGYSNMKLLINSNGDFSMFGNYEIEEGDYLFTALSLINKKFIITKGSTLTWNGDPMGAKMSLIAKYTARASTEPLVLGVVTNEADLAAYKQKTEVEAIMRLRGQLSSPEIRFGINIPDISSLSVGSNVNTSILSGVIRRIENDQEEMTRQVFSLLILNSFIRPSINPYYEAGTSDVQSGLLSSSVGDLLSNQISNWLGQINSNWNFGVNYVFGDQSNQSDILVHSSRKLFKDRLEIQGTVGANSNVRNFSATYSITPDGRFRVRAFNRSGVMQTFDNNNVQAQSRDRNINTQGVGLFYRIEFDLVSAERREARRIWENQRKNP